MPLVAHSTHWLTSLLYIVPVALLLGFLAVHSLRERRRQRREGQEPGSAPPPGADVTDP